MKKNGKNNWHNKKALHVQEYYNNCLYGNGADSNGRSSDTVYKYNVKTMKKSNVLKNFWIDKASRKYLYGTRDGVKYRYNVSTKK